MPVTNLSSPNCAAIEDRRGRFYASSPIVEAVCGVGQSPGRVGADDVRTVVEAAVTALSAAADADWSARAGDLEWDCWETVEHLADDLLCYAAQLGPAPKQRYVPFESRPRRSGGAVNAIRADPGAGPVGLLEVLAGCGALLAAMVQTSNPTVRAYHPYGLSDPEGFAAMGVLETLVHTYDVAQGLHVPWQPPAAVCARALARLMPEVPLRAGDTGSDPAAWAAMLWATGRIALPDRPRRAHWRWDNSVREAGRAAPAEQ